jgi:phage/plasmid-associated DNA primase
MSDTPPPDWDDVPFSDPNGGPDPTPPLPDDWDQREPPPTPEDDTFVLPVAYSENQLAYTFTTQHADHLVYVHKWGQWMRWERGLWREDHAVTVYDNARAICAQAGETAILFEKAQGKKIAASINRASTIAAIERLARHHHRHVRSEAAFEPDPLLLNGPGLQGVRLVIAQETEEGRSWAVSKIKMMTGGDPISARFMRQDFFTYIPQFKIMVLGNHKPSLASVDEAIRRRIHFIPFTITIPEAERDHELAEKLQAEYPAILAWMIEGCLEWQKQGLNPPTEVTDATNRYLVDEDNIGAWIADRCDTGKYCEDVLVTLFASWKTWAEGHNERIGTAKELAKALDTRPDLTRFEQPGTKRAAWHGLQVRPFLPDAEQQNGRWGP